MSHKGTREDTPVQLLAFKSPATSGHKSPKEWGALFKALDHMNSGGKVAYLHGPFPPVRHAKNQDSFSFPVEISRVKSGQALSLNVKTAYKMLSFGLAELCPKNSIPKS